tara:strand:+ start:319 stop:570 length:252 start_codon:yes stop_codon:yes gene_type:complete
MTLPIFSEYAVSEVDAQPQAITPRVVRKPVFTETLNRAIDCVAEGYPIHVVASPEVPAQKIVNALEWLDTEAGREYEQARFDV